MAKNFSIPDFYKSPIIRTIKERSQILDPRKKDMIPSVLDFGPVRFLIPRHFGFCYGVQNAIDIAYKSVDEQQGKRIFLLSEMIHNPDVNADLEQKEFNFYLKQTVQNVFHFLISIRMMLLLFQLLEQR